VKMVNNLAAVVQLLIAMFRSTLAFQTSIIRSSSAFHAILPQTLKRRLYSVSNNSDSDRQSISSNDAELVNLAKSFIINKNAAGSGESTLDGVFDMCSPAVDLYGLKGDDVRPGFTSFFESHGGLHHELLEEPSVVGSGVVQYPFIKRWKSSGEENQYDGGDNIMVWKSIDPTKPRNKVERLCFDAESKLVKVSVVEADASLD